MEHAAADAIASERLASAGVTVVVHPLERADLALWLHLDREPVNVELSSHGGNPDVRLWVAADVLAQLPYAHLAMAIAKGTAQYEGPVRLFLQVLPVVRGTLAHSRSAIGEPREPRT